MRRYYSKAELRQVRKLNAEGVTDEGIAHHLREGGREDATAARVHSLRVRLGIGIRRRGHRRRPAGGNGQATSGRAGLVEVEFSNNGGGRIAVHVPVDTARTLFELAVGEVAS
jgi:hypothetical protein